MPEIDLEPSDTDPTTTADDVLRREFPARRELLQVPRYDFTPDAGRLDYGPFGPAEAAPPSGERPIFPVFPRTRAFRFGSATIRDPSTGIIAPKRETISGPSIVVVVNWSLNGTTTANPVLFFAPASENTPPNPSGGSDLAWDTAEGNVAFLPTAGDWWLVFVCTEFAAVDTVNYMVIDATNPQVAEKWMNDFRGRPTYHLPTTDKTLAADTATRILQYQFNARTAVRVKNTGANVARVQWAQSPLNDQGEHLSAGQTIEWSQDTLPEGDLWARSLLGTTLAVNLFIKQLSVF